MCTCSETARQACSVAHHLAARPARCTAEPCARRPTALCEVQDAFAYHDPFKPKGFGPVLCGFPACGPLHLADPGNSHPPGSPPAAAGDRSE